MNATSYILASPLYPLWNLSMSKRRFNALFLCLDNANLHFRPTMPKERSEWLDGCWGGVAAERFNGGAAALSNGHSG